MKFNKIKILDLFYLVFITYLVVNVTASISLFPALIIALALPFIILISLAVLAGIIIGTIRFIEWKSTLPKLITTVIEYIVSFSIVFGTAAVVLGGGYLILFSLV
jgi:hypothetical protein